MGERVQPGCEVNRDLYEKFKTWVENRHGRVRGALGEELEKAMRDRINAGRGEDQLTRIENDVAHLKALIADAEADGGEVSLQSPEGERSHTREPQATVDKPDRPEVAADPDPVENERRSREPQGNTDNDESKRPHGVAPEDLDVLVTEDKPPAKASTHRKLGYLVGVALDTFENGKIGRDHLRETIRDEFEFGDRALDKYVSRVVEALDAKSHPHNPDGLLVFGEAIDEVREQVREQAERETQAELDEVLDEARAAHDDRE